MGMVWSTYLLSTPAEAESKRRSQEVYRHAVTGNFQSGPKPAETVGCRGIQPDSRIRRDIKNKTIHHHEDHLSTFATPCCRALALRLRRRPQCHFGHPHWCRDRRSRRGNHRSPKRKHRRGRVDRRRRRRSRWQCCWRFSGSPELLPRTPHLPLLALRERPLKAARSGHGSGNCLDSVAAYCNAGNPALSRGQPNFAMNHDKSPRRKVSGSYKCHRCR